MRSGRLSQRATILRASVVTDGRGGQVKTWAPVGTVSAEIVPLSAREQEQAQRLVASVTHSYLMRYSRLTKDLTPKDTRLWCGGKTYEVATMVDDANQHQAITGTAIEVAA
jgi:SPP1 family predicted phage head-tail adaptor